MSVHHFNNSGGMDNMIQAIIAISPMSTEDIEALMPMVQTTTAKKGALLLREGEVCRNIYFLESGLARMFYLDNAGNQINYRFTDSGNFFVDFQSFLTQKPSRYWWECLQDATLLFIPYEAVQHSYQLSHGWNLFGRLMAERVYQQLNERVDMLLFMKPEERYIHLLTTNPALINKISLFHLSSYLGIQPESLSRIRKRISGR